MIEVKEISSKRDKKKFFKFYVDLYRGNPYAVPNLFSEELAEFDPAVNDAFRFCDCRMFLAYKDGKIAGRIAGIWHRGANDKFGEKKLRFTRFDVIDDFEVTKALFAELFKWAREIGMEEIVGPISFSDLNEEGMLVDGFDQPSTYIEIYNYPYYVEHMEKLGAYKEVEWNGFRIITPEKPDPRIERLAKGVAERNGYELLDVKYYLKHDKKKLKEYIMQALDVLDEAFFDLYGTSPLNEKQKKREMDMLLTVIVPEFPAVVLKDDKVIAYGMVIPSMNKVLQKARGKLFPRGIIPYIKTMKHPEAVDLLSVAISKEHVNKGVMAMIVDHCLKGILHYGVKYVDAGPELDTNRKIQNTWKSFEGEVTKTWRCWGLKVDAE